MDDLLLMDEDKGSVNVGDTSLDNLSVALIQCFAVIICGYITGRTHLITQRETSGLNTFVGKFSLPSLIFLSLCKVDLSSVNWVFILAIFLAKSAVFFLVLIVTTLVTRPTNTARAGLLAMLCTQTNDFAIGAPIVQALYGKTHPDYVAYLYLLAPISLVILNPFGFVMLEIGKRSVEMDIDSRLQMIRSVVSNIVTNPIVFMTALGVLGNVVFDHNPPLVLESVLNVFGSAFTGTALMLLGLRIVGRVRVLQGTALLIPALLIITKLLVTPLLMRGIAATLLSTFGKKQDDFLDLTMFSFLYGTLPSAPGVFVYAVAYAVDVDLIAASMVICTFLSAPLMFISAVMISAANLDPENCNKFFNLYKFDLSILSIIGGCIVLTIFLTKKKVKFPHRVTFILILSQLLGCAMSIMNVEKKQKLLGIMEDGSDIYFDLNATSLAVALLLIRVGAETSFQSFKTVLVIFPTMVSMIFTTILYMANRDKVPTELVERVTSALSLSVLCGSLLVIVVCLIITERQRRHHNATYASLLDEALPSISTADFSTNSECINGPPRYSRDNSMDEVAREFSSGAAEFCERDCQMMRHFILLVLIICSLLTTLAFNMWSMMSLNTPNSGLFIELRFMELTLRRGQCLFTFCIFAMDYRNVLKPLIKRVIKVWYGGEPVNLPKWDDLPFETRLLCDQFVSRHLQMCKVDIEKANWSSFLYGKCFSGAAFVEWLIRAEIADDAEEACNYASKLLSGRILRHIYNTEYFCNNPSMMYTFSVSA